jgi:hypothetical protein
MEVLADYASSLAIRRGDGFNHQRCRAAGELV